MEAPPLKTDVRKQAEVAHQLAGKEDKAFWLRLIGHLLLFIYLEFGAMVGTYFKTTELPVRYLIYIAITALARVLIEIVGAEHRTGNDLLIVAGAILVLSFAVLVLRFALPETLR